MAAMAAAPLRCLPPAVEPMRRRPARRVRELHPKVALMSLNRLRDLYPGFDPALIAAAGNSGPGLPQRRRSDPLILAVLELVDHAVAFGQVLERRATDDREPGKQWAEADDATRQMLAAVDRLLDLAGRAH